MFVFRTQDELFAAITSTAATATAATADSFAKKSVDASDSDGSDASSISSLQEQQCAEHQQTTELGGAETDVAAVRATVGAKTADAPTDGATQGQRDGATGKGGATAADARTIQ